MDDLKTLLINDSGGPIGPELWRALLAHLTPLERRVVEGVDARPDALRVTAVELDISEGRCREVYEAAVAWLRELTADALAQEHPVD